MTRLYDVILERPVSPTRYHVRAMDRPSFTTMVEQVRDHLRSAAVIVADNVAEYLYAGTDQEQWDVTRDFPNLAPPFPTFWIETRRPSRIVSRERGELPSELLPFRWGMLFVAEDAANLAGSVRSQEAVTKARQLLDREVRSGWARHGAALNEKLAQFGSPARAIPHLSPPELALLQQAAALTQLGRSDLETVLDLWSGVRWLVRALLFTEVDRGRVIGPLAEWQYLLDAQGNPTGKPLRLVVGQDGDRDDVERVVQDVDPLTFAPLLTLSFLHCKNVELVEHVPPAKLARAHARRKGREPARYYTLQIDPMRKVLKDEGGAEHHGLKRALHICRGHFATYTEERPLFGKRAGTFWIPAHVRGSADAGLVGKEYRVLAAKRDAA